MKLRNVLLVFSIGLAVSYAALTSAAESVGSSSRSAPAPVGFSGQEIEEFLREDPAMRELVDRKIMKKFREDRSCVGPNFEKDRPNSRSKSRFLCRDLFTYDSAIKKNDSLADICKKECLKAASQSATGKSAAALAECNKAECEKKCDFEKALFRTEVDSFVRGAIIQDGDNAESM